MTKENAMLIINAYIECIERMNVYIFIIDQTSILIFTFIYSYISTFLFFIYNLTYYTNNK